MLVRLAAVAEGAAIATKTAAIVSKTVTIRELNRREFRMVHRFASPRQLVGGSTRVVRKRSRRAPFFAYMHTEGTRHVCQRQRFVRRLRVCLYGENARQFFSRMVTILVTIVSKIVTIMINIITIPAFYSSRFTERIF